MPEMHRGKNQILFRYTPEAMFRYNEINGWCKVNSIEMKNIRALPTALAEALWHILHAWDAIRPDNFPDPKLFPNKYELGEPYQVHYTLHPLVFVCRECKRVYWYQNIDNLMRFNYGLNCRSCESRGTLTQVPYMYIHECGRAESIFIPNHSREHIIVMNNRGRFQESNWYCKTCNLPLTTPGKQGLGLRSCQCGPRKLKRGSTLQDPSVHYTRTISMVDTADSVLERALENTTLGESLLAGILRTENYHSEDFEDLLTPSSTADEAQGKRERLREELMSKGISDAQQLEMLLNVMESHLVTPQLDKQQRVQNEVRTLVGPTSPLIAQAGKSRPLLEYVFVRDHPRMQSYGLSALLEIALDQGDELTRDRYKSDKETAERLGIVNLSILEAFPLLLAAIGYSRVYSEPKPGTTAMLRPFIDNRPKIPIYAIQSTTEAMMFELDPWREAAWLLENAFVEAPNTPFKDQSHLRLWLLGQQELFLQQKEAHLELMSWEKEQGHEMVNTTSAVLFGLLHSLSHMLIIAASTLVGFEADSLGEYLFPIAGAGVIYAAGHQEFTLGGIVSAFRMNLGYWLRGAYEAAQRCIYDPLCKSRGAACHACSYLHFSCPHFNRTLSRSFLLGGPVSSLPRDIVGYWSTKTYNRALKLKQEASSK